MGLGKQAKILTKTQVEATLGYLSNSRYPLRNRVTLLLSVKAGLRAKEIANLTWDMVMTSDGEKPYIHLTNEASKGKTGGRVVPLSRELRSALSDLRHVSSGGRPSPFVITTERSARTTPQAIVNLFSRWYEELGFHSGRHNLMPPALPRAPA